MHLDPPVVFCDHVILSLLSQFLKRVLPTLLYGAENWLLDQPCILKLEKFQAEIGRRILHLSKFHSRLSVLLALRWPRARILNIKLSYFHRLLTSDNDALGTRTFNTLASIDVYKLGLTQQYLFLDSEVGSGAVAELLSNPDSATFHLKQAKANVIKLDWKTSVEMAAAHSSTSAIIDTKWLQVWEEVRDHGTYWTSILQKFYKLLTTTLFDDRLCPRCNQHIPISSSFVEHYAAVHCSSTTMFNNVLLDLKSGSFSLDLLHHIITCLTTHC